MENINIFLESSTIHGLTYLSTSRKYARLFWIIVVIAGFSGAGVLIYQSFDSWAEGPVKTTIETLPITEIKFPKVTVCPPKNTYTDLNYDLRMTENMNLDNDTRNELANYGTKMLYEHLSNETLRNLSKLNDDDRYYNWYHGYTQIQLYNFNFGQGVGYYYVRTAAASGTIFTQYFGDKFDVDKVEPRITYYVEVYPPDSVKRNRNITLHMNIEKLSMKGLSTGRDKLSWGCCAEINADITQTSKNHTPPGTSTKELNFMRSVIHADVIEQTLQMMPGFKLSWHYSGMVVESLATYHDSHDTKAFVRKGSIRHANNFKCTLKSFLEITDPE